MYIYIIHNMYIYIFGDIHNISHYILSYPQLGRMRFAPRDTTSGSSSAQATVPSRCSPNGRRQPETGLMSMGIPGS